MSSSSALVPSASQAVSLHGHSFEVFPWLTALPLAKGSMREAVLTGAAEVGGISEKVVKLMSTLAKNLDECKLEKEFTDPRLLGTAKRYFEADAKTLMNIQSLGTASSADLASIAHLFTRFLLLDRLADAYGLPHQEGHSICQRRVFDCEVSDKFLKMIKPLKKWTDPIQNAHKLRKTVEAMSTTKQLKMFQNDKMLDLPDNVKQFLTKISMLQRAGGNLNSAEMNQMLTNMELLAYSITWFGEEKNGLVSNGVEWMKGISDRAQNAGAPLDKTFTSIMGKGEFYNRMKNIFHIAMTVSPLVAISPYRYNTSSARRDLFIGTSFALGNQRPDLLAAAERAIIKCIVEINVGSDALTEVCNFLDIYDQLERQHHGKDHQLDWFSPARLLSATSHLAETSHLAKITQSLRIDDEVADMSLALVDRQGARIEEQTLSEDEDNRRSRDTTAFPRQRATPPSSRAESPSSDPPEDDDLEDVPCSATLRISSNGRPINGAGDDDGQPSSQQRTPQSTTEAAATILSSPPESPSSALVRLLEQQGPYTRSHAASDWRKGKKPAVSAYEVPANKSPLPDIHGDSEGIERDLPSPKLVGRTVRRRTKKAPSTHQDESSSVKESMIPSKKGSMFHRLLGNEPAAQDINILPLPKISEVSFELELWDGDVSHHSVLHQFHPVQDTAEHELKVLGEIYGAVRSGLVNGRPPHRLEPARRVEYDPNGSSIFVTDSTAFGQLTPVQVQDIFRHRHILVRNGVDRSEFSLEALEGLGSLNRKVSIQVAELRNKPGEEDLLRTGTLTDLYVSGTDPSKRRILNALDFPMGYASTSTPPGYRVLASQERAWLETQTHPGLSSDQLLTNDTNWGVAATAGTTTMVHVDDEGMATVVSVVCGAKYWVVMRPKRNQVRGDMGDLASINAYPPGWAVGHTGIRLWEAEGILLTPGDVFYMRPNTHHYVLGVDNTIVLGRHFYSTSTIFDSCLGIIHSSILGMMVTNQEHESIRTFLRRLMAMWLDHFQGGPSNFTSALKAAHMPDIETHIGFFDVVMVGTVLELSRPLSRLFHGTSVDLLLAEEEHIARWRYRQLMAWFTKTHVIALEGLIVSPWYVAHRFLIEFASSLCEYKVKWDRRDTDQGPTAVQLRKMVEGHLKSDFPLLLPRFQQLLRSPTGEFRWSGPEIKIFPRNQSPKNVLPELKDMKSFPVYEALRGGIVPVVEQQTSTVDGQDGSSGNSAQDGSSGDSDKDGTSSASDSNGRKAVQSLSEDDRPMDLSSDSDHNDLGTDVLPPTASPIDQGTEGSQELEEVRNLVRRRPSPSPSPSRKRQRRD